MANVRRSGRRAGGAASAEGARAVRHPDVAVAIDGDAMRGLDHTRAEALHKLSILVELENWIEGRPDTGVGAAALADPDALAVLVDGDGAGRAPGATVGHLRPALDGLIRIRPIVHGTGRLHHDALRARRGGGEADTDGRESADREHHEAPELRGGGGGGGFFVLSAATGGAGGS